MKPAAFTQQIDRLRVERRDAQRGFIMGRIRQAAETGHADAMTRAEHDHALIRAPGQLAHRLGGRLTGILVAGMRQNQPAHRRQMQIIRL